jgi:hypothetical protein
MQQFRSSVLSGTAITFRGFRLCEHFTCAAFYGVSKVIRTPVTAVKGRGIDCAVNSGRFCRTIGNTHALA